MVTNGEAVLKVLVNFFKRKGSAARYLYAKCSVSFKRMPESFS